MSNIVRLRPRPQQSRDQRQAHLAQGFAAHRRATDDVFWLKENAELLGILAACGQRLSEDALAPYETFYDQIDARLRFFPQYYRFLLSLCLDLEDLGMPGTRGQALTAWAQDQALAEAELSDLQRAEARRLLARRLDQTVADDALTARLHRFINRTDTFVMPNKKAAYELTHIVFYLSEYGRRDPGLGAQARISLHYVGLLAYLDQNADLLAEVCIAQRFAGITPSPLWEEMIAQNHQAFSITADPDAAVSDAYHPYLVTGWALQVAGCGGFAAPVPQGALRFGAPRAAGRGALRTLSECMYDLGDLRSDDWEKMRGHVLPYLGAEGQQVLRDAEQSSDVFGDFFAGFARAGTP